MKAEEIEFLKNLNGYNTDEGKRTTNAVKEYTEVVKKDVLTHIKASFLMQESTVQPPTDLQASLNNMNNLLVEHTKKIVLNEIIDSYVNIALDNISIRHNIDSFFTKDIEAMKNNVRNCVLDRLNY